ncbi:MAG TPA: putative metal-binding motif-containing protein [Anaeromyxobacteraceae bacterium]|nr:putative metal-binding motif-containing protein [Anaeromyxobacteraceae bacterium]
MRTRLVHAAFRPAVLAASLLWAGCGGDGSPEPCAPAAESCNGVDDDCDGQVDEAAAVGCTAWFEDADGDRSGGASACLCAPAAPFTVVTGGDCDDASPAIFPGAVETCNGVDEDCDALIDEGIEGCCAPDDQQACGVAQGICTAGTSTCGAGFAWGPCLDAGGAPVVLPGTVAEICNGLDDDCDGATDEDFPTLGVGCTVGIGACQRTGTLVCTGDGAGVECSASPGAPGAELCNGIDDDCDPGTPDGAGESTLGAACDGADADLCSGGSIACVAGQLVCDDVAGNAADVCDGADNDCNPSTPDGSGDPRVGADCCPSGNLADCANTGGSTRCRAGTATCSSGAIVCGGAVQRTAEICDGVDNDCDGALDDVAGIGTACSGGPVNTTGACAAAYTCTGFPGPGPGGLTCVQTVGPTAEICNGIDDDCDGTIDDAPGDVGGACCAHASCATQGAWTCDAGVLVCSGSTPAGAGSCTAGEPCCPTGDLSGCQNVGAGTRCQVGTCSSGSECVGAVARATETCNGVDNDCDGLVDDVAGIGAACSGGGVNTTGACTAAYACAGGAPGPGPGGLTCVQTVGPTAEVCNGIDDDCDGTADNAPSDAGGPCCAHASCSTQGSWTCSAGVRFCSGSIP